MSAKQLSAGDYIASRCSKCKDTTNHTIVAMVEGKVVRVQCNICNSVHNHRSPAEKTTTSRTSSGTKTSSSKSVRQTRAEENWQELLHAAASSDVKPYNMQTVFRTGDFIQHPTFGLGQVINTIAPNKMDIQFEDGVKMLRCRLK